ncbi:hypothetical protein [Nocardioides flavescens]|uniref:Flagellar protein FlgN n=1 Tax=Nocardioides flavescens TaxID=2691959 RepID=A0A6L7EX72_9ACTN|nr:hypothetical protein [Nocardioides flavescens]MXG87942.1 hypothetical protein [Nocardioides flavescens]
MSTLADLDQRFADRHQAWETALDRIELDLIRAERSVDSPALLGELTTWHQPEDYGPIPSSLRPRAEDILARQQQVLRTLGERLGRTAQRQAVVDGVTAISAGAQPGAVYVDVSA